MLKIVIIGNKDFFYDEDIEVSKLSLENVKAAAERLSLEIIPWTAGTLDLAANPTTIIDVTNIKPGDTMVREFKLENNGTLDISKIDLSTVYNVVDANNNNVDDFGKHIKVLFLENADKTGDGWVIDDYNDVISETTLYDLQNQTPDAVENLNSYWTWLLGLGGEDSGLKAGTADQMYVAFEFVDNDADQNEFQGDALELEWTFTAHQTEGESK